MNKSQKNIQSSLLSRLIDDNPQASADSHFNLFTDLPALQQDIKHNLETLLNTRQECHKASNDLIEVEQSVLRYGIADFSQLQFGLLQQQNALCAQIQQAIINFEPRLQNVTVTRLGDNNQDDNRQLHLQIRADIHLKPNSKAAVFETSLDVVNHSFNVYEEVL